MQVAIYGTRKYFVYIEALIYVKDFLLYSSPDFQNLISFAHRYLVKSRRTTWRRIPGRGDSSVMATNAQGLDDRAKASTKTIEPEKKASTDSKPDEPPLVEDAPDPEEDDLDDLDGEFLFNLGLCHN